MPRTGRVHTSYHQAVAATGRLSSTDPNLQNIPIRSPEGRRIRQAFMRRPGCGCWRPTTRRSNCASWRTCRATRACCAPSPRIATSTRRPRRKCSAWRSMQVSGDQRRSAKAINFGLIYGMSRLWPGAPARASHAARRRATSSCISRAIRACGATWMRTREQARREGYVETVFGRRLYLPEIRSRNRQLQQYAERSAINAPMQGTAADIIKRAMIAVDAWCQRRRGTGAPDHAGARRTGARGRARTTSSRRAPRSARA